ncbi:MAG: threonine/serine dehydratase [Anaerolineae bacterium]|nr:threonine/serine dehydratase [Anaerolineae bacterium]
MLDFADIALARYRLAPQLAPTPLEAAADLGADVWLKLENANKTHSFKVRGALNALLALPEAARARGVVTASSGNHAQGIAYAAGLLGIEARVLMPVFTAKRKVAGVRRYGAQAILFSDDYGETEREALRIEHDEGLTYISAYTHPDVIAGQGTIGLEIADVLPNVERMIIPVGGGGLISGIAIALKSLKPSVEIIGVNAAVSPDMYNFFYNASEPLSHESLADALPGEIEPGSITFDLTRRYVDQIVRVSEGEIAGAMRWIIGQQGWLAEGGGLVGVAALRSGAVAPGGVTAVVVSGGNVDAETVAQVLSKS